LESVQLSSCSLCPFAKKKNFVDTNGATENFKTVNPHVRPLSWIAYKKTVLDGQVAAACACWAHPAKGGSQDAL